MAFSGTYKKHLEEVEKSASSSDGKTLSEGNTLPKGKFSGTYNAYKNGAYDPFKTKNISVDYSTLNQNADWDKYSSDLKWKGITDTTAAHIINTDKDLWGAKVWETIDKGLAPLFGSQTLPYRYMTDDERKIYTYLHESPQYGVDYAEDYIKSLNLNKQATEGYTDFYKDLADEHPVLASANSTALNVVNGLAQINPMTMANKATNMITKGWDGYSAYNPDNLLSNISTTERNRVTENIKNPVGQFAYQTGMSMADSAVNMLLFGEGATAVMAINAANARKKELEDAGAPPQQVMAGSLLSGGIEALTESFSIGNFLKPKGIDSLGKLLKEVGKQILTEGSEEVASDVLNDIVDIAMGNLGGYSEIEENKKAYMAQGMSDSDATKRLVADSLKEAALSFLGGGISGGLMGAPSFTYQWHNNANIGSQIASQERVEDLSEQASKYGRDDLSEALQGTPKDATIGMAQTELLKELQEKASSKNATEEDKKRYDEAYRAYALNVSSPKTGITDKDGNVLHVNGIKIVDDELVFETDNGDVAATDTRIANDDIFMMRKFANMIPDDQQKVFAENYKAGENVAQYIKAFEDAYTYGTLGHEADKNMLVENGRLTVEQANNIYQAGYNSELSAAKSLDNARVAIANYRSLIPNADVRAKIDASVISMDGSDPNKVDFNSLTDNQKATIAIAEALASKWNFNIKFFDSSRETGNLKSKNGKYVWKTNTVWLDINAENTNNKDRTNAILTTLSHELTHWAKYNSPDLYEVFKQEMLSTLAKQAGKAVDEKTAITTYVQDQKSKYKEYRNLSMETTEDELVARACENMLTNSELMQETLSKMSLQERQTFVGKIKEFLKNIVNALKDIMGRFDSQSKQYLLLSKDVEALKDLQKKWDAMIKDAAVNSAYTNAAIEKGIADGILLEGSTNGEFMFSEKTYLQEGGKEFLEAWLDSEVEAERMSETEAKSIKEGMMRIYDAVHEMKDKYASYSNWAEAGAELRDESGMISVIVNNGEYALNIDFATVCKKREVLNLVLNSLVKSGDLDLYTLTESDVNKINEIIKNNNFEIACALCFVDSKRYRVGEWAKSFTDKYNEIIYKLAGANGKTADEFNYTKRDINNPTQALISDMKGADTSVLDEIIKENTKNGNLNEMGRIAKAIKNNPKLWHSLNAAEIISSAGLDAIRLKNPELYSLVKSHGGTSMPKLAHSKIPYINDVLKNGKFNSDAAFAVGGVRIQSFSDFVPTMIFDYVQMATELQAKKLPAHAYTKELSFAKLFGLMGIKINMSAIPKGKQIPEEWLSRTKKGEIKYGQVKNSRKAALEKLRTYTGLKTNDEGYPVDKNGKEITRNKRMTDKELARAVYETDDESINLEEAIKLQKQDGYDKNLCVIFVGASDNAIRKMMMDSDIPMIIPYHKSSLNPVVAHLRNIATYTDYTSSQNTRYADGKKIDPSDFSFDAKDETISAKEKEKLTALKEAYKSLDWYSILNEVGYDAKAAAEEYVRRCEKQGWLPKFDQFAYVRDENGKIVKENGKNKVNENYYKLLEDFRMYDSKGNIAKQEAVKLFNEDRSVNMPKNSMEILSEAIGEYDDVQKRLLENGELKTLTEEVKKELNKVHPSEMASDKVSEISEDTYEEMKKHFGTTINYKVAGYMLKDGTMLDFSGKHAGNPDHSQRTVDHREINEVLEGKGGDAMTKMIGNGNIRLTPNLNLAVMPTYAQKIALARYLRDYRRAENGWVLIDFDEVGGDTVLTAEYDPNVSTDAILQDIEHYFKTGKSDYEQPDEYSPASEKVTDKDELERLNNDEYITVYRSFQVHDGGLYSPMNANEYTDDGSGKRALGYRSEKGVWEKATEAIQIARDNYANGKRGKNKDGREYAKFTIDKGFGAGQLPVAYNPYLHASNVMLNDQFSSAYKRDLETWECRVPKSELDNPYMAELAKDSTGWTDWRAGTVATDVGKQNPQFKRKLFLSRYMMPVRRVPDAEVAKAYQGYLKGVTVHITQDGKEVGEGVPWNVVTEGVRKELEKLGVPIYYGKIFFGTKNGEKIYKSFKDIYPDTKIPSEMASDKESIYTSDDEGKTLGFTEERIDHFLKKYADKTNPNYTRAYLTNMSPDIFLRLTTGKDQRWLDRIKKWDDVYWGNFKKERFANDHLTEPIMLYIDEENNSIWGHEGRHRMWQLKQLGVKEIPVVVINNDNKHDKQVHKTLRVLPQEIERDIDKFTDSDRVVLTNLVPLNYGNREKLIEDFGTHADELFSWKDDEGYLHLDFDDVLSIDDFERYLKRAGIKLKERETTKEKYEEALKEVRLRLKTAEEQVRQSAQRDRLVKKIIEREDKLVTMFQKNDSKNHIPDVLKESLVKVLTSVDLASELPKGKLLNHLNAFKDVISKNVPTEEEAMENLGKYFDTDGYFVEAVQGIIDELNEKVDEFTEGKNNVSLYNLSWQSLNKLNEVLTAIGVAARQYDTALGTDKKATISGRAKNSMDFLKNKVPMAIKNSVQKLATSFLGWDNITPIYGYDRFGEGGKQTFKEFIEGDDVATAHEMEIIAYAEKHFTAEEAEKWSNDVHDVTIGGKTYPMTTAQIMSLYCLYRRESTHQHLFRAKNVYGNYIDGQGIVIGEINGKSTETGEIKITEDEINTIIKELDDKQRKVAEALQEFMSTTCADWGNYVTMKRWGIMMFGEENYFPMQVYAQKRNVTAQENNKQASLFQLLNMGFTKSLDPKSSSALIISSIFDVFTKHTSEMASYNAYALAVLDTLKWLNYTEREDGKTLAFKEVIKQVYDKDGKNFIINHIRDLNGQRMELDSAEKFAKKVVKHYKTAATAANLRVVVMQPTAILRAYNVIDGKYIAKALTSGFSAIKQAKAEMNEKSMLAVRKNELGSLDANLSKTIEENVMRTNELKTFKGRMGKVMDASLILAEKADEITWATLYKAVQLEMQEKTKLTGAEFDKAVTERFEDICYRTQVFDSINARSSIMRKKDMWHTMLTAFGAEPTLSYSMLSNEVFNFMVDARGGNVKRSWSMHSKSIKRAFVAFMMTAVAVSAVAAVPDWFRDDDDEKSVIETYFKNFGMNLLGEATGLLPYIRDAYSIIVDGYDPSRPDEEIFASFRKECKALKNAFDEGRVTYRSVYQSAKLFSQITGTPLGNVIRDFKAIWNKTVGEIFDMKIE